MIAHTSDFTTVVTSPVKTVRVKFYLHDNTADTNTPVWVGDEQSISSVSSGQFNNSGAQKISAKIVGNKSSDLNALLKVDLQVRTDAIDWQTSTLGYFTVFQVAYDVDSNISTVDLYDPMFMLSTSPYALPDDTFPCTVADLAETLANFGALDLDPDFSSLPNQDHVINDNLWATIQNTTYRDVINEIAQTTGTTAVTSGLTLLFKTFGDSLETVTEKNLVSFQLGQKWGNVNSISLERQPQQDNILVRDVDDSTANGVFEIAVVNNQIMDDDRQDMIQPLATAFGVSDDSSLTPFINYYNTTLTTEGHGYYEVGDIITANLSGIDYQVFITEVDLDVDGGISEVIKSVIPTDPSVNSTTAGGIIKTLYNTEIKVDKQNNTISSVVAQQATYENFVNENFTRIDQNIDNITLSVQDGGGVNQIKNSVGYSLDSDKNLNFWTQTGTVTTSTDTGSEVAGALSGNRIDFGASSSITQRITVAPNGTLNFSFYAKKETQGVATITLSNATDSFSLNLPDDQSQDWKRFTIQDVIPTSNYLDITVSTDADVDLFSITDMMIAKGAVPKPWEQAGGEVANESVQFDSNGITVHSTVYDGAFTRITPLEFAGYDNNGNLAFALNNDTTEVNNLDIGGNATTTTHDIVMLTSGPNAGMNFVVRG